MAITCCHYCVAPKRYPGCHDHCPEYQEQKAENDAKREAEYKKNEIRYGINEQRSASIAKVSDKRRQRYKYSFKVKTIK